MDWVARTLRIYHTRARSVNAAVDPIHKENEGREGRIYRELLMPDEARELFAAARHLELRWKIAPGMEDAEDQDSARLFAVDHRVIEDRETLRSPGPNSSRARPMPGIRAKSLAVDSTISAKR